MSKVAEGIRRKGESSPSIEAAKGVLARFEDDPMAFLRDSFDIRSLLEPASDLASFFCDWLDHRDYDEYWRAIDVTADADRITVPLLHVAGWYDGFLASHLALQRSLDISSQGSAAPHHFVVGPWSHDAYLLYETACSSGVRDFGPDARGGAAGIGGLALRWFSRWLRDGPALDLPPVRYFMMGPNRWIDADSWPPRYSSEVWYLGSNGQANSRSGDGVLMRDQPDEGAPFDVYDYDPNDPCPTVGGRHLSYPLALTGIQDQGQVEDRGDVLVYTSPRLVDPLSLAGPILATLFVRTSAPTTDFTATLVDVDETDAPANIADGVCRIVRSGQPDDVQTIEISLLDIAYTFDPGHRIRLHITSSSFPRLERNPNLDRPWQSEGVVARQTILHDQLYPSSLALPVVRTE
jgi:putative CocE/NonD family hydrolase